MRHKVSPISLDRDFNNTEKARESETTKAVVGVCASE